MLKPSLQHMDILIVMAVGSCRLHSMFRLYLFQRPISSRSVAETAKHFLGHVPIVIPIKSSEDLVVRN